MPRLFLIAPVAHPTRCVGLILEGTSRSSDQLRLNDGQSVRLNPSQIRWSQAGSRGNRRTTAVNLPVYLNNGRSDVLFTIQLPFESSAGALIAMRAVCLKAGVKVES